MSKGRDISVAHARDKYIKGRTYLLRIAVDNYNAFKWQDFNGDYLSFCKEQRKLKRAIDELKEDIEFANKMVEVDEIVEMKVKQRFGIC